jgi:hypothetical protein
VARGVLVDGRMKLGFVVIRSSVVLGALAAAACGDNGGAPVDAGAADAAEVDAQVCERRGYPEAVRVMSVSLAAQTTLVLDGNGTRCEQLERAVIGADRPPELAQMDVQGATTRCHHDDVTGVEVVRIRATQYGGVPAYAPAQDAVIHVDASNAVVFLRGDFLPAGMSPPAACLSGDALAAQVPGRQMSYRRFAVCVPQGEGGYTIAANDDIQVGAEGVYLDRDGNLRRVRAVDVYLRPENIADEVIASDAFCCTSASLEGCVGQRLFLDALTGETIAQEPHCHIC